MADMTDADIRQSYLVLPCPEEGGFRPKTVADHHANVSEGKLSGTVPQPIRVQWDTARNIWLYAWHVWRFYAVAEMQAFATLELALRRRLGPTECRGGLGLKRLMKRAISMHLVVDAEIEYHRQIKERPIEQFSGRPQLQLEDDDPPALKDPQAYCKLLADMFPRLRNHYAHGSESIHHTVDVTFAVCRDLIDQLFNSRDSSP